ncbi:MAG: cytochrome P450 [Myxococcota bacterium]
MSTRDETLLEVPGGYGPPVLGKLQQTLSFGRDWRGFLAARSARYGSTVFRTHVGLKAITVIDPDAIRVLFDPERVRKPYGFGPRVPPPKIVGEICPTAFTDGERHRKLKSLYIGMMRRGSSDLVSTFDRTATPWFERWARTGHFDLTQGIADVLADFFFEWTLGARLPKDDLNLWVQNAIPFKLLPLPSPRQARVRAAFDRLTAAVRAAPRFSELLKEVGDEPGLDEVELSRDLVFTLVINGWAGTVSLVRSVMAELSRHPDHAAALRQALAPFAPRDLDLQTLSSLEPLDHFLKEVLRMHPCVPISYGVARADLVLETRTGRYRVRSGEVLMGVIETVQHDPACFEAPEEFRPERFADPSALEYLVWPAGSVTAPVAPGDKVCAGRDEAMLIGALFAARLLRGYQWELEEKPEWTKPLASGNVAATPLRVSSFAPIDS